VRYETGTTSRELTKLVVTIGSRNEEVGGCTFFYWREFLGLVLVGLEFWGGWECGDWKRMGGFVYIGVDPWDAIARDANRFVCEWLFGFWGFFDVGFGGRITTVIEVCNGSTEVSCFGT